MRQHEFLSDEELYKRMREIGSTVHGPIILEWLVRKIRNHRDTLESVRDEHVIFAQGRITQLRDMMNLLTPPAHTAEPIP
jgi:hypothetical protein